MEKGKSMVITDSNIFNSTMIKIRRTARRTVEFLMPEQILMRVGRYRPSHRDHERWEQEYANGVWNCLRHTRETSRYSVVAGYYLALSPGGRVLDVGCGEGLLQTYLTRLGYEKYVGIDISHEAVAKAANRNDVSTEFQQGDIERFSVTERFDTVILNEMLNYCNDPQKVLQNLNAALNPNGIIIVSLYHGPNALRIWRLIDPIFKVVDATTIKNGSYSWTVKVFLPDFASGVQQA